MPKQFLALLTFALFVTLAPAMPAAALPRGEGTVVLVDGTSLPAEILFEHPSVPRLVLRSVNRSTVQSLPLAIVHSVKVGDATEQVSARRDLTDAEKQELERNRLWGDEVGEGQLGRYAKTTWEPRPLIVWAKPGQTGNAMDAGSWLDEAGQTLKAVPWKTTADARGRKDGSFDGDILLPAGDAEYKAIQPGNRDHLEAYAIRHLTVESNASYQVRYTVLGNLWVKDGARLGSGTQTGGLGSGDTDKDTFARFCNFFDNEQPTWANTPPISHWVRVDAGENGSLEIIGQAGGASDRTTHSRGTLIISRDSYLGNGPRGSFYNQAGSTTIMLDGAKLGCPVTVTTNDRSTYGVSGTLMFGAPDKPLTKDLIFDGVRYLYENVSVSATPQQRTAGASFVLGPTGKMVVHSVDPTRVRVVFQPRSKDLPITTVAPWHDAFMSNKRPTDELWGQPGIANHVIALFRGETDFNGVVFNGFHKGGIIVDPKAWKEWKNVSYGPDNQGQPHELIAWPPDSNSDIDLSNLITIEPDGAYEQAGQKVKVTLSTDAAGMQVRYTTDGSIPHRDSPLYESPLLLTQTTTVTAGAFKDGFLYCTARSAVFEFKSADDLNLSTSASANASASFGGHSGKLLNDDDDLTYWRGGTDAVQTIDLQWDEAVSFNHLTVIARPLTTWVLQVPKGDGWTDVVKGEAASSVEGKPLIDVRFDKVTTDKVRLRIEGTKSRPVINEIRLFEKSTKP